RRLVHRPEDTSLRGMPTALEQEFVETCLKKAAADYKTELSNYLKSQEYKDADPKPDVPDRLNANEVTVAAKQLAGQFTRAGTLNQAGDVAGLLSDPAVTAAFNPIFQATLRRNTRKKALLEAVKEGAVNTVQKQLGADP